MRATPSPGSPADVARVWDARAERYLELFRDELAGKPHDLQVLEDFADRVGRGGRVCDAGCGPCGHVTALLAGRGLDVVGVDLSPVCVDLARREQPTLRFEVMDMRSLEPLTAEGALDGLVSYYSLHDQPRAGLTATVAAWAAAIRPGGQLLVVVKEGTSDGVVPDPLGSNLQVWWTELPAEQVRSALSAHFRLDTCRSRSPYEQEIASPRAYVTATRTS